MDVMDPLWAAILGGAVGGVIVAVVESVLSRSREHGRWIREQRQRHYAEFIGTANALRREQRDGVDRLLSGGTEPVSVQKAQIVAAMREVEAAWYRLSMVASHSMMVRAAMFENRGYDFLLSFEQVERYEAHAKDLWDQVTGLDDLEEFTEAARRELGAGHDLRPRLRRWFASRRVAR